MTITPSGKVPLVSSKSAKFLEKNSKLVTDSSDFMNNLEASDPKEVSDRNLGTFENYLSLVQGMYFGYPETTGKNNLNDLSNKLNSRNQEAAMGPDLSNDNFQAGDEGLISGDFYFSTLDML